MGWFIQWQTSDPLTSDFLLITLACRAQPGWVRRSRSCCQEEGAAQLPTLGGMEGPSFTTPSTVRWRMMMLLRVLQSLFLELCIFIYVFIIYLITWQNFTWVNAEVLLRGVCLELYRSNRVGALQCPWWFSLSTFPYWLSSLLHNLTLNLTQLSLGFPISSPHFPITPDAEKTALWNFAGQDTVQELGALCLKTHF